jgi:uncharacterized protein YraI
MEMTLLRPLFCHHGGARRCVPQVVRLLSLLITLLILLMLIDGAGAQVAITATTTTDLGLRIAPGIDAPVITDILAGTAIDLLGRDTVAHWLLIEIEAGAQGWIPAAYTTLDRAQSLRDLPVSDELVASESVTVPTDLPTPMRTLTQDDHLRAMIDRLEATPALINLDTGALHDIHARGLELGIRADVFTRVGDSDTTSGDFLRPIGMGGDLRFCELGPYVFLRETVEFFSTPRGGYDNSFDSHSAAAINGLSAAAVLDPLWTDSPACLGGESPLACEYRLAQPSVAIIMLGRMDVIYFDLDFYRTQAERILQDSISRGVIPVLTTFVVLPDNADWPDSIAFNNALIDLAEAYQTPLINLWAAVQPLPNYGIGPDDTHLSHAVGSFCAFDGPQWRYGGTLRNLLTLQALDEIRRSVLQPDATPAAG